MGNVSIGFNAGQAKELMNDIEDKFNSLKGTVENEWPTVQATLHREWIGEDEESFETFFVQRVNDVYKDAAHMANYCMSTIADMCNAWISFQSSNVLDGGTTSNALGKIEANYISDPGDIISAKDEGLDENTDRGLASGASSATNIQTDITAYVKAIKGKAEELFGEVEAGNAFFGDQVTDIKTFIEKCGEGVAELMAAVKDLYTELEKLAGVGGEGTYSKLTDSITTVTTENSGKVDSALEEHVDANTRWTE